jgi:hypothetical protein
VVVVPLGVISYELEKLREGASIRGLRHHLSSCPC